jgi:hypothetical protein
MSAFLCSDNHINALVEYAFSDRDDYIYLRHRFGAADKQALAELLYNENWRSLRTRYNDPETGPGITYRPRPLLDAITILKLCDCYDYQACETEDYDTTRAAKAINFIRHKAIRALPGYEEAPWGLD